MRGTLRSIAFAAVVAVFALAAFAQTETGQISGTVTDPTGAVVSGTKVTIKSLDTQAERSTTTNIAGLYTVTNLQHGTYELTIDTPGFSTFTRQFQVTVGAKITLDAPLSVGAKPAIVEVVGENGVQVETQSQELSQVIDSTQITELPTLTRNPYDLVATAGNVGYSDSQVGRGVGLAINGQRAASTDILLDGGENVNLFDTTVGQSVPLDSVQEFRVITSDFSAEYGRASGGIVNVATKSGTDRFHGSLYEFNRVSDVAANTFENISKGIPKGAFTRNQFGFSLGGPVLLPRVKNKLFFFGSAEWTRVRSNQLQNVLVPTPQFLAAATPATQNFFNAFGNLATPINGPIITKSQLVADGVVTPTPGGPLDQLPASTPILGQVNFAVPSDAGGGNPQNSYSVVTRFDYILSNRTTIYGRYALQSTDFFPGTVSFSPYKGFNTGQEAFNNNGLASVTHVFAPNLVSQTKAVFNRLNLVQPLGAAPVGPTLFFQQNTVTNILGTNVALPGYLPFSPGNAIPFGGPQNVAQISEDLSYTHGKHQLRFGGEYIYVQDNRVFGAFETAVENLSSGSLGASFDNFLSGNLFSFQGAVNPQGEFPCVTDATGVPIVTPSCTINLPVGPPNFSRSNLYNDGAAYAQDTWRVRPRLTVNLGARWDYYGVQHNRDRRLDSNFFFGAGSNIFERTRNGLVATTPNSPIDPRGLYRPRYHNFAPRIGFAWDVFGNGKTSLHGGYGIAYERNFGNVTYNVIQNPPAYAVISLVSGVDVPSIPVTTSNFGPLAGSTGSIALPRTSLRHLNENLKPAYAHIYSLALEHEVAKNTVVSLEYSGSRGIRLYSLENPNRPGSGVIYLGDDPSLNKFSRLNRQYTNINTRGNNGFSYYNALNIKARTNNLANTGLSFTANYTWAHATDNLSSTFSEGSNNFNLGLLDPFNPRLDKGNADFDIRHRLVFSGVWQSPLFHSSSNPIMKYALAGWSVAPIATLRTGTPYSIWDCTNAKQVCPRFIPGGPISTEARNNPPAAGPNLFNLLTLPPRVDYANSILGISDFGPFPANMTRRNAFRGPRNWNTDIGIYKNFQFYERLTVQFRSELLNAFNHHNFYVVGSTADASLTPFIQAKKGSPFPGVLPDERRNVQFALKVLF